MMKKIWRYRWVFRSLFSSIYFIIHYVSLKQSIRLTILLYMLHLLKCKGSIKIEGTVKPGMIKLGTFTVSIYPNNGFIYENHGGEIIFKGPCLIGNNSAISVGDKGVLIFGQHFTATTTLKIVSYCHIEFKDNVLCGWDCLFSDTDFHQLTLINSSDKPKAFKSIVIGNNNWFALKCIIMKGVILADNNVIAAHSLLNRDYSDHSYCLFAGVPAQIKRNGIYRDPMNDKIFYHDIN